MEFFKNSTAELHTYDVDGNLWFALDDVLNALELTRSDISELEDDEIRKLNNGKEWVEAISEGGFYYLMLFESKTEDARKFCDWVMNTVIRSITEKGYYAIGEEKHGESTTGI